MRIIFWSIISWVVLACIAVVIIFSVLKILEITKETVKKSGISRNEFIVSLIISVIVFIVLSFSVFKYFAWKRSTNKVSKNKTLETSLQKEEPIKEIQSPANIKRTEQVLKETITEQVESSGAALHEEAASQGRKKVPEKRQKKLSQPLKPSRAIFTVQMGAFSDFSHAKSLKGRFSKKGYDAYISSSSTAEGNLYKVCIGKFVEREKAKTLSEKIRNTEGLEAFVTSLQP